MKNKRLFRKSLPNYFSSHTTHLINCFLTLMRREFVKSKYLVIKRNLLQSIELDTQLFFENFLKFNTKMNDIYKLIESFRMEDQFPNEMFHNNNQFIGPSEIAQEFNTFFISQFTPCDRQYRDFPPSVLNEIDFSLEEVIETLLQTSDGMVLTTCQAQPFGQLQLHWVYIFLTWPEVSWKLRNILITGN